MRQGAAEVVKKRESNPGSDWVRQIRREPIRRRVHFTFFWLFSGWDKVSAMETIANWSLKVCHLSFVISTMSA
jgi:hypothetical protein